MNPLSPAALMAYWSSNELGTNAVVFLNVLGALLLGLLVGYERFYHGRAAGMRTYGLVCMTSSALTVAAGYPDFWFGGNASTPAIDPTRVIQGIVTGVGFLGAGIIMRVGLNISGLTTAASIWAASGIGVLVGLGFYFAAILVSVLSAGCMMGVSRLERLLPARHAISVSVKFMPGHLPDLAQLRQMALRRGYEVASGSFSIRYADGQPEWSFIAVALGRSRAASLTELSQELSALEGVHTYQLEHARN